MLSPNEVAKATAPNTSFSRAMPGLQLAVDSTSLGEFKVCPRKYFYNIICGWQPAGGNPHLQFGILLHGARERYDRQCASGVEHEEALRIVLAWVLGATWNSELQRPWTSGHATKNRLTLVQTVVWYLDELGQNDPLETYRFADGTPAVELPFAFDSGYRTFVTNESITFCGHLDRLARFAGKVVIPDVKTTGHALNPEWFKGFSPGNQFSMYLTAGRVAFKEPIQTLIIDGIQIGVGFARFQRGEVTRSVEQLDEWYEHTGHWLKQMELCADEGLERGEAAWPQNDRSCDQYGGCEHRATCSRTPSARPAWLSANFTRRQWDPLARRSDI